MFLVMYFQTEAGPGCSGAIYSRRAVHVHIPLHTVQHEGLCDGALSQSAVWTQVDSGSACHSEKQTR